MKSRIMGFHGDLHFLPHLTCSVESESLGDQLFLRMGVYKIRWFVTSMGEHTRGRIVVPWWGCMDALVSKIPLEYGARILASMAWALSSHCCSLAPVFTRLTPKHLPGILGYASSIFPWAFAIFFQADMVAFAFIFWEKKNIFFFAQKFAQCVIQWDLNL